MKLIVAYDIAHPRRLQRIARLMKDYGVRVQKSVFEIEVSDKVFRQMKEKVEREIGPGDGVKYFPLCGSCGGLKAVLGHPSPVAAPIQDAVIL